MEIQGPETRGEEDGFLQQNPAVQRLAGCDRERVLDMARDMLRKGLPKSLVLASVRSTATLLLEIEDEPLPRSGPAARLLRDNPTHEPRVSSRRQPRSEIKTAERDRLLHATRSLIREARSAKQPHERKKMRRSLLSIDQGHLRRVLGRDANDLCDQINDYLNRCGDLR